LKIDAGEGTLKLLFLFDDGVNLVLDSAMNLFWGRVGICEGFSESLGLLDQS
jgi:hypothetical protein